MIGIYQDNFKDYLKDIIGIEPKITNKNIIIPCPFCEYKQNKKHYHLYISLEAPIFHCFKGTCNQSGFLTKLFSKLEGKDLTEKFVDREKVKESVKKDKKSAFVSDIKKVIVPELNEDQFKLKTLYLKSRLKFSNLDFKYINGLIFDIDKFITLNQIPVDEKLFRIKSYLQSNFVGFLTENESLIVLRNIDDSSDFRYFKLFIREPRFLDYYKLYGLNYFSNHVVLSEGIFDIFNEHIFDFTKIKNDVKLYAAALSTNFDSLIKSIVFNEQIFRLNVSILSDKEINLNYYKKIKRENSHIIDRMTVYYNKLGKDFGESPVIVEKFIL